MITLPNTPFTRKKSCILPISANREYGRLKNGMKPRTKSMIEAKYLKIFKKKFPINNIKSLSNFNLEDVYCEIW